MSRRVVASLLAWSSPLLVYSALLVAADVTRLGFVLLAAGAHTPVPAIWLAGALFVARLTLVVLWPALLVARVAASCAGRVRQATRGR